MTHDGPYVVHMKTAPAAEVSLSWRGPFLPP